MAERSSILSPISEDEEWRVTAYLIAISPDLQRSVRERRAEQQEGEESPRAVEHLAEQAGAPDQAPAGEYDQQRVRGLYESPLENAVLYFEKAAKYARPSDVQQAAEAHYFAGITYAVLQRHAEAIIQCVKRRN